MEENTRSHTVAVCNHTFFIRNQFISNLVLGSLKFKKLLELHVPFIRNHFISNLVLDSLKFKKLLELHVLFIRNHFISNLVLDSLKFKKLLELQGARELKTNSTLKSLPGST